VGNSGYYINKELRDLYRSSSTVRVVKPRRLSWLDIQLEEKEKMFTEFFGETFCKITTW
jgi:hypothetical protein